MDFNGVNFINSAYVQNIARFKARYASATRTIFKTSTTIIDA